MFLNTLKFLAVLIALVVTTCTASQPSYQVSLYVHLHPRGPPLHLCNGVIVQSRLIMTTASCVHYKFSSGNSPAISIDPSMITVLSGSTSELTDELSLQVSEIFVADNFNYTTGANDLALLRLNGILPLDARKDMSWITLADDDEFDGPCLANFYVRNSQNGGPNYIQSEQLPLLEPEVCGANFEYGNERENDVCSLYYLPAGFNCNAIDNLQNFNGDRGTGLICGNKLMGLLSTILPLNNKNDCIEKPIKAYYTGLAAHLSWLFEKIGIEDLDMYENGEYIASAAYDGETNAFVRPQESSSIPTLNNSETESTATPISSAQHNAAFLTNGNLKLLTFIFAFKFLVEIMN